MAEIRLELDIALPSLSKAVFSQPVKGADCSKVTVRPVLIKNLRSFQIERFRDNKAFHENVTAEALLPAVESELEGRYRQVLIVTDRETRQYTLKTDGRYKCTSKAASLPLPGGLSGQNREKSYILSEGEPIPALVDLGVFNSEYRIVKAKYDKYKQIDRFIRLIDDEFRDVPPETEMTVLDFGCGKSYLTFILYYYFNVKRGMKVRIIGYDLKADVVEHCNAIAKKYGYERLEFIVSDVTRDALYDRHIDMIVTLHACDVATDYALHYAISHGVKHIFSVPCCQHEVNAQIRPGGELDIFLRHGIIKERMAALLTDSIRAAALDAMGYAVDMIEFTDFEHSPKNLMIRAEKKRTADPGRLESVRELCRKYSFTQTLVRLIDEKKL